MPSNTSQENEIEPVDVVKRRSKRIETNCSSTIYYDVEDNDFTEEKLHSKRKSKSRPNGKEGSQSSIVSFLQIKPCNEKETKRPQNKSSNEKKEGSDDKPKKKAKSHKKAKPIDSKVNDNENLEVQTASGDNRKVRFSNNIMEYSPEVVKRKVESSGYEEKLDENHSNEQQVPVKNAFTFMMDSRNKIIGQNLSGKELEKDESSQDKTDLLVRKSLLQEWADTKGAKKRKFEYEETGITIESKLKKRAKRLKQMLTQERREDEDQSEIFAKKRRLQVIQSDSDCEYEIPKSVSIFQENVVSVGVLTENINLNTTTCETEDLNLKIIDSKKSKLMLKKKKQILSSDLEKSKKLSENLDEISDRNLSSATPNTMKKWKMRIRVPLSDEEEVIKSNEIGIVFEDFKEVVKPVKLKKNLNYDSDSNKEYTSKKVASIFVKSKRMSAEAKEARKTFLHSGIPDALKKIFESEKIEELEVQLFPTISHVMVKPTEEEINSSQINYWNLPSVDINYANFELFIPDLPSLKLGSITLSTLPDNPFPDLENQKILNLKSHLHKIKAENPHYPVYKVVNTFHQIHLNERQKFMETQKKPEPVKRKRGRKKVVKEPIEVPKVHFSQMWTELYKPSKSDDIFGNRAGVSYIKKWLQKWLEFAEMEFDSKLKQRRNSDSSLDFEQDEREDSRRLINNTLILIGPHGSGKTSAVYAICNELDINVLEVNASSKRNGKRLLNDLQEATQSHQVRKAEKNALSSFLHKDSTKSLSQSSSSSSFTLSQRMCILLIEDVDVVFDQDENFISSLAELINTSKRPLILTLSDRNCLHLKRFLSDHKIVTFKLFEPKTLSTWLQVLCLKEGLWTNNRALSELLENNGGDIRRTLLQIQFWVLTGGHSKIFRPFLKSTVVDGVQSDDVVADESSNMSWLNEGEGNVSKEDVTKENTTVCSYKNLLTFPLDLGKIWWNLPGMLGLPSLLPKKKENEDENRTDLKKLEDIANVLETMALTDVWYTESKVDCDSEPVCGSKCSKTKDSLSLNESFLNYSAAKDFCYDISHTLLSNYVQINNNSDSDPRNSISNIKCWYLKQKKSTEPFHEITPPDYCLNHRAINVDYFSTLRQIARSEHIRSLGNSKRNNRFYHYLRNLGMSYNSAHLEVACNVLRCDKL